jgi:hypothetical protein
LEESYVVSAVSRLRERFLLPEFDYGVDSSRAGVGDDGEIASLRNHGGAVRLQGQGAIVAGGIVCGSVNDMLQGTSVRIPTIIAMGPWQNGRKGGKQVVKTPAQDHVVVTIQEEDDDCARYTYA